MKSFLIRLAAFALILGIGETGASIMAQTADAEIRTSMALRAVNGDADKAITLRAYNRVRQGTHLVLIAGYACAALFIFAPYLGGKKQTNPK